MSMYREIWWIGFVEWGIIRSGYKVSAAAADSPDDASRFIQLDFFPSKIKEPRETYTHGSYSWASLEDPLSSDVSWVGLGHVHAPPF